MKKHNEFQAGLFVLIGVVLFIVIIWMLGQDRQIFEPQERYRITFLDVQGLSEGAPVRLGGITIGRVDKIGFSKTISDPLIYVDLLVSSTYLERIRTDSIAAIETQGLLGDKFVSIRTENAGNLLEPGSIIKSTEPVDMGQILNKAGLVVDNTVKISQSLNDFIGDLQEESFTSIKAAATSLSEILHEIKNGNGFLSSLIYSKKNGSKLIANLEKTSANLGQITDQIKTGDGLLSSIIYDKHGADIVTSLSEAAKEISSSAKAISDLAKDIQNGDGLLNSLVYDKSPGGVSQLMDSLSKTAANLEKASKALAEGNGTLGALLVDAQLYDNLVEVTDGAKRSFILKQAVKQALSDTGKTAK